MRSEAPLEGGIEEGCCPSRWNPLSVLPLRENPSESPLEGGIEGGCCPGKGDVSHSSTNLSSPEPSRESKKPSPSRGSKKPSLKGEGETGISPSGKWGNNMENHNQQSAKMFRDRYIYRRRPDTGRRPPVPLRRRGRRRSERASRCFPSWEALRSVGAVRPWLFADRPYRGYP